MLERKAGRRLHENASEDEGFGRSTLSADITTATWGGSTQMSSTQNDSAVSEGSSNDSDEEVGIYFIMIVSHYAHWFYVFSYWLRMMR